MQKFYFVIFVCIIEAKENLRRMSRINEAAFAKGESGDDIFLKNIS